MKKLCLIAFLIFLKSFVHAQYKLPATLNNDTTSSIYQNSPLIIVITPDKKENRLIGINNLDFIKPTLIKNISVYKDNKTIQKYGEDARFGVIIITYKKYINIPPTPLNLIQEVSSKIEINDLPIYVDSVWVNHPENVYIPNNQILSITVEKEKESGIQFIDVITKNPPRKPTKGEIMIREIISNH